MTWRELEREAPEIAQRGRERLDLLRVALIATLRQDGSPRISPIEPYLSEGDLLFGAMAWSPKTRDLLRDPRCVLHSAITGPDNGEGEFKLYGRALEAEAEIREGCSEGWWHEQPPDTATVFALSIQQAILISWDTEHGQMTVQGWSPRRGLTETKRSYP